MFNQKEYQKEYWKRYYATHKHEIAERKRVFYQENKDKIDAYNKDYFKKWYLTVKDDPEYRKKNAEKCRQWYIKNRERAIQSVINSRKKKKESEL